MRKINILGTVYKVYLNVPYDKDPSLAGAYGYTDFHGKRIVVADIRTVPGWEDAGDEAVLDTYNCTVRHEIIHAYLMESGLNGSSNAVECWARNEEMVDWFACQMPKLIKTFNELGV